MTLWKLVKDGKEVAAFTRPLTGGGTEFLSTWDGELFFSKVFVDKPQLLRYARKIGAALKAQGWSAAGPRDAAA